MCDPDFTTAGNELRRLYASHVRELVQTRIGILYKRMFTETWNQDNTNLWTLDRLHRMIQAPVSDQRNLDSNEPDIMSWTPIQQEDRADASYRRTMEEIKPQLYSIRIELLGLREANGM
jgi:hypothetical protein